LIPLEAIIESQKSLEGVNLPESTTLTPILESDPLPPKTELNISEESIILEKEPIEVTIQTGQEPRASSTTLLISNNTSSRKEAMEGVHSDELSKCLQDAVTALCAPNEEAPQQSGVSACRGDEDEVREMKDIHLK